MGEVEIIGNDSLYGIDGNIALPRIGKHIFELFLGNIEADLFIEQFRVGDQLEKRRLKVADIRCYIVTDKLNNRLADSCMLRFCLLLKNSEPCFKIRRSKVDVETPLESVLKPVG